MVDEVEEQLHQHVQDVQAVAVQWREANHPAKEAQPLLLGAAFHRDVEGKAHGEWRGHRASHLLEHPVAMAIRVELHRRAPAVAPVESDHRLREPLGCDEVGAVGLAPHLAGALGAVHLELLHLLLQRALQKHDQGLPAGLLREHDSLHARAHRLPRRGVDGELLELLLPHALGAGVAGGLERLLQEVDADSTGELLHKKFRGLGEPGAVAVICPVPGVGQAGQQLEDVPSRLAHSPQPREHGERDTDVAEERIFDGALEHGEGVAHLRFVEGLEARAQLGSWE
mmetsp:Transcript_23210/g.46559  ORF Transcript_23210/g.46559 Transcript_23210/m.46559 type:complete len:284 (-) Transcript_23210:3749-4600(-)